jgi:hypothetical protein
MTYRVLYLLKGADLHLLEIQRLDLPATAAKSEIYQWLHYLPASQQLTPLTFVAMHSNPPFEERTFAEGELRFSNIEGVFRPTGTRQNITLHRDFLPDLPPELAAQLAEQP